MDEKLGSLFLKTKYNTLSNSPDVAKANPNTTNPVDRIDNWLKVIERTHISHISKDDAEKSSDGRNGRLQTSGERVKENLKKHYFEKNIKVSLEVISAGYWNNKASIMINQGRGGDMESSGVIKNKLGNYIFPEEMKEQELGTIIKNQKDSLSSWFNYLTSDDAMYPMWAKYWVFQSVLKMGKLIKHEQDDGTLKVAFQNRLNTTTSPFPLLNQQALAKTISTVASLIEAKANLKGKEDKEDKLNISNESASLDNKQMLELAKTESFSKIYAQFLKEIPEYSVEGLENIAGQWKVYEKGSSPEELVDSLKGCPLECWLAIY